MLLKVIVVQLLVFLSLYLSFDLSLSFEQVDSSLSTEFSVCFILFICLVGSISI